MLYRDLSGWYVASIPIPRIVCFYFIKDEDLFIIDYHTSNDSLNYFKSNEEGLPYYQEKLCVPDLDSTSCTLIESYTELLNTSLSLFYHRPFSELGEKEIRFLSTLFSHISTVDFDDDGDISSSIKFTRHALLE